MSVTFNHSAMLVEALLKIGCSAEAIDSRLAKVTFDELEICPEPGKMTLRFFSKGNYIYSHSCEWHAGQTVRFVDIEMRVVVGAV